jgi:hypothetical protein
MKKIIITILLSSFYFAGNAQLQKTLFVGLNAQPLYISAGLELTAKIKNSASFFLRPTYNRRQYGSRTGVMKYVDVPFGVKILIVGVPAQGSAVPYNIDFSAGPFIGYAFSGKYYPASGVPQKKMTFGTEATTQFDAIDYGYFLNTQLNIGLIGFSVSAQVGTKKQDMSRLGLTATPTKQKSGTQFQICMNVNLPNKRRSK